jgi:serine/threonine-protein kinase RsbW
VVLDLREVTYVDSSALGLIVWLDHKLSPADGRLLMAGASKDVERILELSGLVGVAPTIGTSDSVDEAVDSLDGHAPAAGALRWSESIVLPAEVSSLAKVRKAVCDMLEPVRLTGSARFDVKVAVGEALANAVRHGSPGGGTDQVRIDVTLYADRVVIEVRDTGGGFDASDVPTADLYASGGRGVLFMRALMDEVSFRSDGESGGTVVQLTKRLGDHGGDHGGGSPVQP